MEADKQERAFRGVWIDKEVWLDANLSALDKIILTEITSLDNEDGCYASNKYIADFCQCSESKVSKSIAKLIDLMYLEVKSFNGRTRVLQSCLAKNARQASTECQAESEKMLAININNNKENKQERKKESTSYDDIINELIDEEAVKETLYEFIKMRKLIKKPLTDNALKLIIQRLNKLSENVEQNKIDILDQSIINSWQNIYPLKVDSVGNKKRQLSAQDEEFLKELEADGF